EGASPDARRRLALGLFVARRGDNFAGSDLAPQAARGGAAGGLVPADALEKVRGQLPGGAALLTATDTGRALGGLAAAWRRRLPTLRVVCITGSTGKTSTKELIAEVLASAGPTLRTEGNLNNEVGVPLTLFRLGEEHRYAAIE